MAAPVISTDRFRRYASYLLAGSTDERSSKSAANICKPWGISLLGCPSLGDDRFFFKFYSPPLSKELSLEGWSILREADLGGGSFR